MKPNFALNLSHEGISLLHRATTGWLRVGDVALDDPDLNDQLKMLRKTAADLESGGLTSKLVIPNSQILYTEIDAPGPDNDARLSQIRDGLVGLTPYDVNDLVFDWRLTGTKAQVAVVARETLREAEAFAAEFRFNPVSFIGVPVDTGFDGEPYFGPTRQAATLLRKGETIEPDQAQMILLGPVQPSAAEPEPEPVAGTAPVPTEPAQAFRSKRRKSKAKPKPKPKAAKPAKPAKAVETAPPQVAFSSRRSGPAAAAPAARRPPPLTLTHRAPEPAAGVLPGSALDLNDVPDMPARRVANGRDVTPMPVTAAHTADPQPPKETRRNGARDKARAAGTALVGSIGKLGKTAAASTARMRQRPVKAEPGKTRAEADALTVFGARGTSTGRGTHKYLGLVLTLALLLSLAILALWSALFLGDNEPGFSGAPASPPAAPTEIAAGTLTPAPEPPQPADTTPAPDPVPDPEPKPEPDPTPDPVPVDPPAAVDPDPVAPENPVEAAVETALLALPLAEDPVTEFPGSSDPEAVADRALEQELALLPDPAPVDNPPPDRIVQPPPTRAEAEASYAASGIWQMDPEPLPDATGGDRLEDLYIASIDPVISAQDAVALPSADSLDTDLRASAPRPPPPLGSSFELDARGLVPASPEGTLSPSGVQIFAGTPPAAPGPRPGSAITPPAAAIGTEAPDSTIAPDPELDRLRQIRPQIRPDNLQETFDRSRLGGFSRSELAQVRPTPRPASLQETRTASADTPAASSATDLAVLASLSPPGRPGDFSATVRKALEEAAQNPPEPSPEPTTEPTTNTRPSTEVAAARVPPIPTRASVAKQATVRNAIKLGKINLIGVYGSPSDRRALLRLKSGRYVKVEVGDRVDGGRVAAIGASELRYVKRGRNITLKLPKG